MSTANGKNSLTKSWFIGIGLAIILFSFILALFLKRYENDQLWNITLAVFSFLGVLLTAGAAVPAVSAILSYQNFTQNAQRAEKDLENLEKKLNEINQNIENALPDLSKKIETVGKQSEQFQKIIERQDIKKIIYRYVRNRRLTKSEETLKDC
ncbi:hypothetical protein E4T80_02560 [Muribacter muris]|uniref:Uncharacterized protein n=1 Tax=Muribacter muris TaxID=67855 RepID=A0A4Y9K651_9PAST|nr:hypothetical protein [Muribacter muris]MBF0784360.1 hypothetical protein [Muribacter muris]MBF0827906.1 hypothetical protein [Muribacter muris]TFV12136.1 hypothetical protein E4T80_02560 [Muribacter muris]